jgi:putative endonuclease
VLGKKGWTMNYRPWTLVYKELYNTKSEALSREKELKTFKCRKWIREEVIPKR